MLRTRVGYCGGKKENPTYLSLGDHTEAVAIDYDPNVITYRELLQVFAESHHCGSNTKSRQYMNAVFFHNEQQRKLAEEVLREAAIAQGTKPDAIETHILPATEFTYAESYHQKYYLRQFPEVRRFLREVYPEGRTLADSAVATRLNAWLVAGLDKDITRFESELADYGLPEPLANSVKESVTKRLAQAQQPKLFVKPPPLRRKSSSGCATVS